VEGTAEINQPACSLHQTRYQLQVCIDRVVILNFARYQQINKEAQASRNLTQGWELQV